MQFKPQKVQHLEDALALKTPKIFGEYAITEKFNGWDTSLLFNGSEFQPILSSSGKPIVSLDWLHKELNAVCPKYNCIGAFALKAEAIIPGMAFEEINGILNRSTNATQRKDVVLKVHNIVPLNIVKNPWVASERLKLRTSLLDTLKHPNLHDVPVLGVHQYNEKIWLKYFHEVIERGGEGIVALRLASIYMQGKRNADVLKLKMEITRDVLATRLEETIGEQGFPGLTLISKRKNGAEILTVIGKHSLQQAWRANPNLIIGKVVQVSGMYEYPNGKIKEPVFQHIRHDKNATEID